MRSVLLVGTIVGSLVVGQGLACDDGETCVADCTGRECGLEPNCGRQMCGYCPADRPNCNEAIGRCEGGAACTEVLCAAGSALCCEGGVAGSWNPGLRLCSCPYCGDFVCNGTETCSSCPDDCGACPCTSALCSSGSTLCCAGGLPGIWNAATSHCDCYSCATYSDCGTDDICISGRCESAWGRAYRVTAVDATLPAGIDSDDSVPDCYITTWIDGTAYRSTTVDEDYTPTWNHSFDVSLNRTSSFTWTIYDWDPIDDDELTWRAPGETWVDVDWLRTGTVSFHDAAWTLVVTYEFDPR